MGLIVHHWTADGADGKPREFLVGWVHRALANLERWTTGRDYVATDNFTIADILMAQVLSSCIKDEALIAAHLQLVAYRDRCVGRPARKKTFEAYSARVQAGGPAMQGVIRKCRLGIHQRAPGEAT